MKIHLAPEALRALLDSESYREFVRLWIVERSKIRRFGFSDIARNGRFVSRSFPRDVQKGTKRITLRSLAKFSQGMGLTGDLAAYFKLLVEMEEPECRSDGIDILRLKRTQAALKSRLLERAGFSLKASPGESIFLEDFPRIYAGLGTEEGGASLKEVSSRTGLSVAVLKKALSTCVEQGWVRKEKDRYFASVSHVNVEGLNVSIPFQKRFARSCSKAMKASEVRLNSPDALFFSSAFSVRAANLPALKDELRSVLLRYVEKVEVAEGDRVVEMVAALV